MGLFQNPIGLPILGLERNYSLDQIPSLSGKVAIVTGGSRGIGYETSLALARAGAKVYIAATSQTNAEKAVSTIQESLGGQGDLQFLELKLQSIIATMNAGKAFLALESRLDIIVANAGIQSENILSEDGIEMTMAVNHVGHQAFISTILPLMLSTVKTHGTNTRIAVTSSHSHFDIDRVDNFDFAFFTSTQTPTTDQFMDFNIRYARSKLANNLFAKHLSELLLTPEYKERGGEKVFVNTAHPGFVKTDLVDTIASLSSKTLGFALGFLGSIFGITPAQGALTQLFLASSPIVERENMKGKYFVPIAKEIPQNKIITSELASALWDWTDDQIKKASASEHRSAQSNLES